MKKLLLLAFGFIAGTTCFAQTGERTTSGIQDPAPVYLQALSQKSNAAMKGNKLSDTIVLLNNAFVQVFDTSVGGRYDAVTPYDSGYIFGTNIYADDAFAEQYNRSYKSDTTLRVLGIYSIWRGTISSASTRTVNLRMWKLGSQATVSGTKHFTSGFPSTVVATLNKSVKTLGIGNNGTDTIKTAYFSTAVTNVNYPFYIGYDIPTYTYTALAGDTFTVRTTRGGYGALVGQYKLSGTDTIFTTRNAIRRSGVWKDAYADLGYVRNLSMMPIVQYQFGLSVIGTTRNDLTFYGHYPNPATDKINVKFALARATTVTIQVVDMAGHLITDMKQSLGTGTHEVPVSVSGLAAGNYTYAVYTAEGDGMASIFTVTK